MTQFLIPRRRFLQGAAAFGTLATASSLKAATSVNFQLSWLPSVQFGGSYIAKDKGYWTQEGLDVALQAGGPNAPVEPPVVSGTALMGISAADYTAAAVEQGAPFKIIAVAMQKNPFAIASLTANPVNEPSDLEGKSIGMATSNMPVLQAICDINGVDIDKIEIVPTQYDPAPLVSGQVDCLLCWKTDLPVAMTVAGIENTVMLLADFGYAVDSQTYIATEDSLKNNRATLLSLLKGELQGWKDYKTNTDAVAELTVSMFPDSGLDLETQKVQAAAQVDLMYSKLTDEFGFGWFTDESIASNIETLGLLGRSVNADLWDRSLLEEAYAG